MWIKLSYESVMTSNQSYLFVLFIDHPTVGNIFILDLLDLKYIHLQAQLAHIQSHLQFLGSILPKIALLLIHVLVQIGYICILRPYHTILMLEKIKPLQSSLQRPN